MTSRTALSSGLVLLLICWSSGCGKSDQNETLRGLQEENKVLSGQVTDLQQQTTSLKAEIAAGKTTMGKDFEDRLARVQLLHEDRVKQLESRDATLMLELGSVRQERLALQEVVNQRPRLQEASQTRFGIERTIWVILVAILLVVLVMVASKYHKLRGQLNVRVVREASSVRQLERAP